MLHFLSKLISRLYFILIPQCEKDFFKTSANSRHWEQFWWQKQPFFVVVIEKLFFPEKLSNIGNMLGEIENPVIFDIIFMVAFGTKLYSYCAARKLILGIFKWFFWELSAQQGYFSWPLEKYLPYPDLR